MESEIPDGLDAMYKTTLILASAMAALVFSCAAALASPGDAAGTSAHSYILRGQPIDKIAEAVEDVGGTVTHSIDVIKIVGATLTEEQKSELAAQGIRITLNGEVESSSVTAAGSYRDDFQAKAFNNNSGPSDFSGPWIESGSPSP